MNQKLHTKKLIFFSFLCFYFALALSSITIAMELTKDDLLTIPVGCNLGKDCWISNLPEHSRDGEPGFDYHCNKKSYLGHSGTDFAIRDMKAMKDGVDVISPIDGTIARVRDGVTDISVKKLGVENLNGKDCGNAVAIERGDYEYLLCHMKEFSLVVHKGQKVKRGQKIGEIGLSGRSEYPHLHITARKKDKNGNWAWFDPFYNKGNECGADAKSMWLHADALEKAASKGGLVYNFGFSYNIPTAEQIRKGDFNEIGFARTPNIITCWVDIFSTNPGDKITLRLHDPESDLKLEQSFVIDKYQARYMKFIGKKLYGRTEISKNLKLEIEYTHKKDGTVDKYSKLLSSN